MRFTRSQDGKMRATLRVVCRMEAEDAALALALAAPPDLREAIAFVRKATKALVERELRRRLVLAADPALWQEDPSEEFEEVLAAAQERVAELWPETAAA